MRNTFKLIIKQILFIINNIIPKNKKYIYIRPRFNYYIDKYDLINYNSSNLFNIIHYIIDNKLLSSYIIFLEYTNKNRFHLYNEYLIKNNANNVVLINYPPNYDNIFKNLYQKSKSILIQLISNFLICESSFNTFTFKSKNQLLYCTNYFIPFKNDFYISTYLDWKNFDKVLTTSLLCANITSASQGVRLDRLVITGFPRNDNLLKYNYETRKFLIKMYGNFNKLIIYAPTFRDYDNRRFNEEVNNLISSIELNELLKASQAILIIKLHPIDKTQIQESNYVKIYKPSYDYNLYSLLSITDILISDYSSVALDFLITKKPILLYMFDKEEYIKKRGLSYEPIESVIDLDYAYNLNDLIQYISNQISNTDYKSYNCTNYIHKYIDNKSTIRSIEELFNIYL